MAVQCDSAYIDFVNPAPLVDLGDSLKLCRGFTLLISAENDGSDYLWSTGETTQMITIDSEGWYSVIVTDANGCMNYDSLYVFEDECVGIDEQVSSNVISAYPNPTRGKVYFNLDIAEASEVNMTLQTMEGRVLERHLINLSKHKGTEELDLQGYSAGIYFAVFETPTGIKTIKLVLQ